MSSRSTVIEWCRDDGGKLTPKEFLYKTYIDKLPIEVLRVQAIQITEQVGWNTIVERLDAVVELTLDEKPTVKLGSTFKANNMAGKASGILHG